MSEPCEICIRPGEWCGYGGYAMEREPCVGGCGEQTALRSACGAPRQGTCPLGQAEPAPEPAPPVRQHRAPRSPRAPRTERVKGRTADQQAATAAAIAGLATGAPLRLLKALEGPFSPMRRGDDGRMHKMFGRPPLPPITYQAHVVSGYRWKRTDYTGPVTILDRSGAWVGAASSVVIAHGALVHTGQIEFTGLPGYYLITVYPWYETDMPHPLGQIRSETAWVPAPTVGLLRDLVAQGRWPDIAVLDSYTGVPCRLSDWTGHVNALRKHALTTYGRHEGQDGEDGGVYGDVKRAFGQALSLMVGHVNEDKRRVWDAQTARPDIYHHVVTQGGATLWRCGDDARKVLPPALRPVLLGNIDEMHVPTPAVEILTTTKRPGGRDPLVIDQLGVKLGTFKIKGARAA